MIQSRTLSSATLTALSLMIFAFVGCATSEKSADSGEAKLRKEEPDDGYAVTVEKFSAYTQLYNGLSNVFQARATLHNEEILARQLRRKALIYQWTDTQLREEREKALKSSGQETQVFLGFFAADTAHDDLSQDNSVWRVILESDGQRYPGIVKKNKTPRAELAELYPYLDRWSSSYTVTFAIPVGKIESAPSKVIITGPIGEGQLNFAGLRLSSKAFSE